jgi:transposase-like protein
MQGLAKTTKHNYKLSQEDKQQITLEYYLNRKKENIEDLCNRYNISKQTIYNIIRDKKNQKQLNDYINQSRSNFTKKTSILIDKAIDRLNDKIENEEVNAKDLVTTIGVLYDKNRLENNQSTSNNSININIKIE